MAVDIVSEYALQTDTLNFSKYAEVLADVILNTQVLPVTIGIFGDWGSGKTTLMRMVRNNVKAHTRTIWFNAWKYDDNQYLVNSLLKTVYDKAMQTPDINAAPVKEILKQVAGYLGEAAQGKRWGTLFFETLSHDPTYKNMMEAAMNQVFKQYAGENGRIVIFIDDLDRCLPENIITMFQMINLYLNHDRCVVVLGGNRVVFEQTITQYHPHLLNVSAKDYMEKIVQVPFTIPHPDKTRIRQFLYQQTLPTGEAFKDVKQIADMILSASENMRHLKFLINQLKLILDASGITSAKAPNVAVLVKLLIVQARFSEFYTFLQNRPDAIHLLHQVLSAKDKNARQTFFERLPALEQYADNDDLMGFLRVSAQITCPDRTQVEQMMQLAAMAK